jgi:hypothetical protein
MDSIIRWLILAVRLLWSKWCPTIHANATIYLIRSDPCDDRHAAYISQYKSPERGDTAYFWCMYGHLIDSLHKTPGWFYA